MRRMSIDHVRWSIMDNTSSQKDSGRKVRTLLALDLGAQLGWAKWENGVVTSGSVSMTKANSKRFDGPGMKFVRFGRFLSSFPSIDYLSFEEVRRHMGVDAAHAYGGYLAHLTAYCDSHEQPIPYEGTPVATIKRRATGNGAATKDMMIEACQKTLGIQPADDNEADALWLLVIMTEADGLPWPGGPVTVPEPRKKAKKAKKTV